MAIGLAAKELAKKLLKNKSLKKAINVTTKQTNKLKDTVKVSTKKITKKPAVKKAIAKTKEVSKKAVDKTKEVASKVADKTPDSVKKVASKTGSVAKKVGSVALKTAGVTGAGIAGLGAVSGGALGGIAGAVAGKAIRTGATKINKLRGKPNKVGSTLRTKVNETKDTLTGAAIGGVAGGVGALVGAGALTASILKSSTPKESLYDVKKQPDGNFVTAFNDANKNKITSSSQLSSKEMGIVRGAIAGLDAILLSEDPRKERTMFNGYLSLLSKYGVTSVNGKNLSVNIAG